MHFSSRVNTFLCTLVAALLATGCASQLNTSETKTLPELSFQNRALNPGNGGLLVGADKLLPGDIILTADNGLKSSGIRLITLSPVSHAALITADYMVVEAVGEGIRRRTVAQLVAEESTVVVFRHPKVTAEHMVKMGAFFDQHLGHKYNYVGVMLQAPFALERQVCELPLVPHRWCATFAFRAWPACSWAWAAMTSFSAPSLYWKPTKQRACPSPTPTRACSTPATCCTCAKAMCRPSKSTRRCSTWGI